MDTDINFLTVIDGRKYVVMAKMKSKNEIEFYEVHFIRRNGYIVNRPVTTLVAVRPPENGLEKRA